MKTPMHPSKKLLPLVPLYASAIALKNFAHDHGLLRAQRLAWPVVSAGNLSIGGTGKTPFVAALAALLQNRGWNVDVLSRGHGRQNDRVEMVDRHGSAQRYGDEPLLLARAALSVYVGRKRYDAGRLAESTPDGAGGGDPANQRRLHLLDDGMQHRRLARAVEIVLLERRDLTDQLLPAGRLREPLKSLRRADICILREDETDLAEQAMRAMGTHDVGRVWIQSRSVQLAARGENESAPQRAVAFCGLGQPAQFFASVRQSGIAVRSEISFPDHYAYAPRDMDALVAQAKSCNADALITTEKDSVRLEGELRNALQAVAPLHVVKLEVRLKEPDRCVAYLENLLRQRTGVR